MRTWVRAYLGPSIFWQNVDGFALLLTTLVELADGRTFQILGFEKSGTHYYIFYRLESGGIGVWTDGFVDVFYP